MNNYYQSLSGGEPLPEPLPEEKQIELFRKLPSNPEVREILIIRNLRLVEHIANRFENTQVSKEILVSDGRVGLIKGIDSFSLEKNVKPATYLAKCIENEILMNLRKERKHRDVISYEETISKDQEGGELQLKDILFLPENFTNKIEQRSQISSALTFVLNHYSYSEISTFFYYLLGKKQRQIEDIVGISQSFISRRNKKINLNLKKRIDYLKEATEKEDIIFLMEEQGCCIKIFEDRFANFDRDFKQFLSERKNMFFSSVQCEHTSNHYIEVKLPYDDIAFLFIAEFMMYLDDNETI